MERESGRFTIDLLNCAVWAALPAAIGCLLLVRPPQMEPEYDAPPAALTLERSPDQ